MRKPDFNNLLAVLHREVPARPTLFEFFLNQPLYERLAGRDIQSYRDEGCDDELAWFRLTIDAFTAAGYDYTTVGSYRFGFPTAPAAHKKSKSLNDGSVIHTRADFESYAWPDPDAVDYARLSELAAYLPDGMKLVVAGPGGVLENTISLVGFDTLCILTIEDPALVQDIFDAVGSRLVRYYAHIAPIDTVGAMIGNDDWGFNRQTMLSPADMRRYVFPWHKRIVQTVHAAGKPAILHSCGNLEKVMDDVIDDMRYDAKHSFEDNIEPIEKAYEHWGHRIALLGGLDLDFVCRQTPEAVKARAAAMIERTRARGGWALGTGNSVPDYVPPQQYLAMISAVVGDAGASC